MENKVNVHANHRQRLKKRALKEGLENFEPHNVLELLLFFAIPHRDTNEIAHDLINHFGSLNGVFSAPFEELVKVKGVKEHAATLIHLIPELTRYFSKEHNTFTQKVPSEEEIKKMLMSYFVGNRNECVVCSFFDINGVHIDTRVMFHGSINRVGFSYREFVNQALILNAYKVAVAHNHPTGNPIPSADDIDTWKQLKRELAKVNVELIDSYVVAGDTCTGTMQFIDKRGFGH